MIVFVHSLGSVWQTKAHASGATSVWNTTGLHDGKCMRPRSEVYGQVALGRTAQFELHKYGTLRPWVWITSELTEHAGIRKLQLIVRAPAAAVAEFCLVTISEAFVGPPNNDGWDAGETQVVSHSRWNGRQEIMLLMRPFGWIKSERATATLIPSARGFDWRVAQWIAR